MEHHRAALARAASLGQGRTSSCLKSRLSRRHFVADEKRREIQGHAQMFSVRQHLLATPGHVVRLGGVASGLANAAGQARQTEAAELEGVYGGWNLFIRIVLVAVRSTRRGATVGKTKKGKGTKIMVVADGNGTPLGVLLCSATSNEVKLIEQTLEQVRVPKLGRGRPRTHVARPIYDKASDSDKLRLRLKARGTDLITPHKVNRIKPPLQDGRKLRRYHRRWKIERTNAWIQNFRHCAIRYDRKITMFTACVQLACDMIALRRL